MVSTAEEIEFVTITQSTDTEGYIEETEARITLIGSVSPGTFKTTLANNYKEITASLKIILHAFELQKFRQANPKYVIWNGQKKKILGVAEYVNHIEIFA